MCLLVLLFVSVACSQGQAEIWTETEKLVGKLVRTGMLTGYGTIDAPLLTTWVQEVGGRVTGVSSRRGIHYNFDIMDTDEANAFSLPGGYIIVTRGLLNHVVSDEELAGVLAHEVAHSDDRDFARLVREQVVFLGAQSLLRGRVNEDWIIATQLLQLLQTLRSSRRHEAQADVNGVSLTLRAQYDPAGLVSFLDKLGSRRGRLERLLATHPPPDDRLQAVKIAIAAAEHNDSTALQAVAADLKRRGHYRRAARAYETAARTSTDPAGPLLEAGKLWQALDEPTLAKADYEQALTKTGSAVAQEALAQVQETTSQGATAVLASGQQERLRTALGSLHEAEENLYDAERKLYGQLLAFDADQRIAEALQAAQVIAPETNDKAYLSTVAAAHLALVRAQKQARQFSEVYSRGDSIRAGWEQVTADLSKQYKVSNPTLTNGVLQSSLELFLQQATPAVQATRQDLLNSAQAIGQLRAATRRLAEAFLALVGSGPSQPLGRLNYTRFLLLQSDVRVADLQIREYENTANKALEHVLQRHLAVTELAVTVLHAGAGPTQAKLDRQLVANRLRLSPVGGCPAKPLDPQQPLGGQIATRLAATVEGNGLQSLQVRDCLMRITYLDLVGGRRP